MTLTHRDDLGYIHVDNLMPNAWNPQEQTEAEFNELVRGMKQYGFTDPITVVDLEDGKYRIIAGEHRWRAAMTIGLDEIPAKVLSLEDWDEDLQKFQTVRANVLQGKMSPEKFLPLYNEMVERYGREAMQQAMGFVDQNAFDRLVKDVKKGVSKTLPSKLRKEFEERSKEAKSVDDLSLIIQSLFNQYGETVSQSFMVFTYGKREHIYIAMTQRTRKAMDKVLDYVAVTGEDINEFMAPIIEACTKTAEKRLERAQAAQESGDEEDVGF